MSRRPVLIALLAALTAAAVAAPASADPGDLPRLTGVQPLDVRPDWFDDHSVSGDNHLSWSPAAGDIYVNRDNQASQREPHDIEWESRIQVGGAGDLEICGYPSGTVGWMRAYQFAPGDLTGASCPVQEPTTGRFGWFRYVYGRHSQAGEFDRWHVMDLERSALVPLNPAVPTVWDNHWGTCLNLQDTDLNCVTDRGAAGLDVGVSDGQKVTGIGDVDAQTIPVAVPSIADGAAGMLPDGDYQIVTLTNPYGLIEEEGGAIGSVQCVNVHLTIPRVQGQAGYGEPAVTFDAQLPANCLLPTQLDPALTGPGGFDPMAGGDGIGSCVFTGSHCWLDPPGTAPHDDDFYDLADLYHIPAHSLATGNPMVTPRASVPRGSAIPASVAASGLPRAGGVTPSVTVPVPGAVTMAAPPSSSTRSTDASRRAISTATLRTRTALRRVFGTGLTRLRVSCRLRPADASTCAVSWRKRGARYSGHVHLRNRRVNGRLRWQYRVDVTRRKSGKTTHVRRDYRTGGTV
jgi:hypothetical protein